MWLPSHAAFLQSGDDDEGGPPAGVLPDEGTTADGLPRVPRSLNWVRIAQRFPVRVKLIDPPPDLVRIGETVSVVIDR